MASSESVELTVEQALEELREMFPRGLIRRSGSSRFTRPDKSRSALADEAMQTARAWKEQQS